jgi:hypothetical protein
MGISLCKAKWGFLVSVKLVSQQIKSRFHTHIAHIALEHIQNKREGSPFFFYFSIEGIVNFVKKLLKSEVCSVKGIRIIASKRPLADKRSRIKDLSWASIHENSLQKYIHESLKIETVPDSVKTLKKVNFVTAIAFEGCDIYQKTAVGYICADGSKVSTKLEIHTKITQIFNRIRDSTYKDKAFSLVAVYSLSLLSSSLERPFLFFITLILNFFLIPKI